MDLENLKHLAVDEYHEIADRVSRGVTLPWHLVEKLWAELHGESADEASAEVTAPGMTLVPVGTLISVSDGIGGPGGGSISPAPVTE